MKIQKILDVYRRTFWKPEKYARYLGVKIGEHCLISTKNFPTESYLISIGNHVRIAQNVSFFTHGGLWSQRKKHGNLDYFGKISVGDYTYIGKSALIMPGVKVGNDVIIGAGSVVTKSIPDNTIVAGNPIRVVGKTDEFVKRIKQSSLPSYGMSPREKKEFLLSQHDDLFVFKNYIKQ